ncbi:hypothetical protein ANN_17312 [Periplaneta americana]|uniref:Uncharacterized protein n=1 Tax=Periplaneta americana TaxID=6978 RepID=A0ABQ8SU01_PERAM|nr:hypothetical protein ANN_17312 [Periplaneta americana]
MSKFREEAPVNGNLGGGGEIEPDVFSSTHCRTNVTSTDKSQFVLNAVDHNHPPSLEEVETLRHCIRLNRAVENDPVAGPAQIIQRELEEGFLDVQKVTSRLRDLEFKKWCELPHKGKGVEHFAEHPPVNRWPNMQRMAWRDALKMASNVAAVRAIPGRMMNKTVLGSCPHGEALRNTRHHKVRSAIAQALRNTGFTIFEEVHGLSTTGSTRRIDMIAFQDHRRGFIIDPTVRFESCKRQPQDIHKEKQLRGVFTKLVIYIFFDFEVLTYPYALGQENPMVLSELS